MIHDVISRSIRSRLESGNLRLKQAIDILLDHIIQLEEESRGDAENSEDQCTESRSTKIQKAVKGPA